MYSYTCMYIHMHAYTYIYMHIHTFTIRPSHYIQKLNSEATFLNLQLRNVVC